jgi:hypothetical protein
MRSTAAGCLQCRICQMLAKSLSTTDLFSMVDLCVLGACIAGRGAVRVDVIGGFDAAICLFLSLPRSYYCRLASCWAMSTTMHVNGSRKGRKYDDSVAGCASK